ncbi:hypothetical protein Taro_038328, partial [Colocasia esculenta]|nr:hypothetical protein [Colocasia esculenta]
GGLGDRGRLGDLCGEQGREKKKRRPGKTLAFSVGGVGFWVSAAAGANSLELGWVCCEVDSNWIAPQWPTSRRRLTVPSGFLLLRTCDPEDGDYAEGYTTEDLQEEEHEHECVSLVHDSQQHHQPTIHEHLQDYKDDVYKHEQWEVEKVEKYAAANERAKKVLEQCGAARLEVGADGMLKDNVVCT